MAQKKQQSFQPSSEYRTLFWMTAVLAVVAWLVMHAQWASDTGDCKVNGQSLVPIAAFMTGVAVALGVNWLLQAKAQQLSANKQKARAKKLQSLTAGLSVGSGVVVFAALWAAVYFLAYSCFF